MGQFPSNLGAYEPLNIYDAPGVLAAQLMEDEFSLGNLKRVFLDPSRLSPAERTDLADKLVGPKAGAVEKAFYGVATNPWVWLMFLSSPVGAKALQTPTKSLFSVAKKFMATNRTHFPWFNKLLGPLENLPGTAANSLASEVPHTLQKLAENDNLIIAEAQSKLIKRLDERLGGKGTFTSLDPTTYRKDSKEWKMATLWGQLRAIEEHGLARPEGVSRPVWEAVQNATYHGGIDPMTGLQKPSVQLRGPVVDTAGQSGEITAATKKFVKERQDIERGAWQDNLRKQLGLAPDDPLPPDHEELFQSWWRSEGKPYVEDHEAVLVQHKDAFTPQMFDHDWFQATFDALGGTEGREYLAAADKARRLKFVQMVGDDDLFAKTGQLTVSEEKMGLWAQSMERLMHTGNGDFDVLHAGSTSLQGKEAMLNLLGKARWDKARSMKDAVARGRFIRDELTKMVQSTVWNDAYYMPRNVFEPVPVTFAGKKRLPLSRVDLATTRNIEAAPWAATDVFSKHLMPLTEKQLMLHTDDLEFLHSNFGGKAFTQQGLDHWRQVREMAQKTFDEAPDKAMLGMRLDGELAHRKYMANSNMYIAWDVMPATDAMVLADVEMVGGLADEAKKSLKTRIFGGMDLELGADLSKVGEARRFVTPGMIADRMYLALDDTNKFLVRDYLVPGALANAGPEYMAIHNSVQGTKNMMRWFATGPIGKMIEGWGGPGKEFVGRLMEMSDPFTRSSVGDISQGIARYFYATHLGLNVSSMLLNMTQPLLLAASIGRFDDVAAAYKDAFTEMAGYAKERAGMGRLFLNDSEKLGLMQKHFKFMGSATGGRNTMGIGPSMDHLLDWQLKHGMSSGKNSWLDLMMKGFEKTEWLNRNVTAHLYERVAARAGRTAAHPQWLPDLERFVSQTQFGAGPLNTPLIFQKGVLANPMLRQFFSFPLRSLTSSMYTFPTMGGSNYLAGLANLTARQMGMSALVYEVGKGLLGADLSRGLYAGALMDAVQGDQMLEQKSGLPVPIPPVIDVPLSFVRGLAQDDAAMLSNSVARMVPGGVSLMRALSFAPELPGLGGYQWSLQKQFVDWNSPTPDGLYPVYKGDGSLIDYKSPTEMVAKATGADMGAWQKQGELDSYLVAQREEILRYRQDYLRALASNELSRASQIQAEFKRRFKGIPLTVTQAQIRTYLRNRATPRTERALDRIAPEVRQQFQQVAAATSGDRSVPAAAIAASPTARGRDPLRPGPNPDALAQEVARRQEQVGGAASQETGAFRSFR